MLLTGVIIVPENFIEKLESYTRHGDRVLALAWKPLDNFRIVRIQKVLREQLDVDLLFVGFVVMENRLKSDTKEVLRELDQANIRTVMITGDNMQTAIAVARKFWVSIDFRHSSLSLLLTLSYHNLAFFFVVQVTVEWLVNGTKWKS